MFCNNCGKYIKDNLQYCLNCGVRVAKTSKYSDAEKKTDFIQRKMIGKKIAVPLAIVLILALLIILFGGSGQGDPEDLAESFVDCLVDIDSEELSGLLVPRYADDGIDLELRMERAENLVDSFLEIIGKNNMGDIECEIERIKEYNEREIEEYNKNARMNGLGNFTGVAEVVLTVSASETNRAVIMKTVEYDGDWFIHMIDY